MTEEEEPMKVCPECRSHFSQEHVFCPEDGTLLLLSDPEWEALLEYGAETILVFRPVSDSEFDEDDVETSDTFDTDPFNLPNTTVFDPNSRTDTWFAEGQQAEAELACAQPTEPLPGVYSRALEGDESYPSMSLRHVPLAVSILAGIVVVTLTLL
jgi:hypothetical protein